MIYYAVIKITRVGRHRKGDVVRIRIQNESPEAVADSLRTFCRDYLVSPKYEITVWTDGTWGCGDAADLEAFGGGEWTVESHKQSGD